MARPGAGVPGEALADERWGKRTPARRAAPRLELALNSARVRDSRMIASTLGAIVVVGAGVFAGVRRFDGLYGQDAFAYFDYATGPLRHALLTLEPWPPFFWPPGYPLLVSLASMLLGQTPLAGQLVSLLMGGVAAAFTYLLARELDLEGAAFAGLLVALCGQVWQSSVVVMSDTTGLATATVGIWALARYARRGVLAWLLLASLLLSYATLTRWIYGLVAVPCAVYALASLRHWQHAAAALLVAVVVLVPTVAPGVAAVFGMHAADASFAGNFEVYSWSPLNAMRRDFFTADGHLSYTLPNGLYYALLPGTPAYLGPLLAPLAAIGAIVGWRTWPRKSFLLIVGWAAIVFAFHAGAPWQNIRFALAYLPPLAILAGAGLAAAWRSLGGRRVYLAAYAAVGLLVMLVGGVRLMQGFIDRKNDDLALVSWINSQVPADAQLLSFGPTLTLQHYGAAPTLDMYEIQPTELAGVLTRPTYVLLDESNVEQQWLGQTPDTDYRALRDGPGLALVGTRSGLSLFRVQQ
ncbi:MAG: glycosyltransferase family 39 protein, partial [Chloroflexi bacterium]|nr:glycosyltransferase family 39 protein [Chloroflexota bacterium]